MVNSYNYMKRMLDLPDKPSPLPRVAVLVVVLLPAAVAPDNSHIPFSFIKLFLVHGKPHYNYGFRILIVHIKIDS